MEKKENAAVSELSQLLVGFVELCELCENLNPLSSDTGKTGCIDVCVVGARCIDLLNRVDVGIGEGYAVLGKLRQLDPEKRLEDRKNVQQWMQMWGRALEQLEELKDAMCFCTSLVDEKTKCSKGKKDKFEFRDKSLNLAFNMLWELQEVLASYKAKEYPILRNQLVNSHLKDFRNMFVQIATAQGPCYAYELPDECKDHDLPDVTEGTLTVFHGRERHELTFYVGTRQPLEWHVDNTGLLDYMKLLRKIWDCDTGRPRFSGGEDSAVWVVDHPEGIEQLEEAAYKICRAVRGLRSMKEYEGLAKSILEIVRNGSRRWETCKVPWVYLNELDRLIAELDRKPKNENPKLEPLPENAAAVYELLKALPKHRGLTGKEILNKLEQRKESIIIDQSTLTKNIIPTLRPYGVKNKRGAGYFISE